MLSSRTLLVPQIQLFQKGCKSTWDKQRVYAAPLYQEWREPCSWQANNGGHLWPVILIGFQCFVLMFAYLFVWMLDLTLQVLQKTCELLQAHSGCFTCQEDGAAGEQHLLTASSASASGAWAMSATCWVMSTSYIIDTYFCRSVCAHTHVYNFYINISIQKGIPRRV